MSFNYSPKIVTDGLVFYLDAANVKSYVSGSTTFRDLGKNNYSGSLINTPRYDPSNGGAIAFNNANDYVEIVRDSAGSATSDYTMEAWTRFYTGSGGTILARGRDTFGNGWSATIASGNIITAAVVTTSTGNVQFTATASFSSSFNAWYHVIGVWKVGTGISLYINGISQSTALTTTTTLRSSTVGWNIAAITNVAAFSGSVAIAKVYNRALTQAEIQQNYNATKGRFGL